MLLHCHTIIEQPTEVQYLNKVNIEAGGKLKEKQKTIPTFQACHSHVNKKRDPSGEKE